MSLHIDQPWSMSLFFLRLSLILLQVCFVHIYVRITPNRHSLPITISSCRLNSILEISLPRQSDRQRLREKEAKTFILTYGSSFGFYQPSKLSAGSPTAPQCNQSIQWEFPQQFFESVNKGCHNEHTVREPTACPMA